MFTGLEGERNPGYIHRRERTLQRLENFFAQLAWQTQYGHDEEGQTMVEYGLIIALVSIVAIAALGVVGTNISSLFNSVAGKLHS